MEIIDPDLVFHRAEALCLLAVESPCLLPQYKLAMQQAQNLEHSGWKKRTGMTQNQKIIKHLRDAGSITVREAIVEYSISSLTKRISELRALGYSIVSKTKQHPITGQDYVRYHLNETS